MKFNIFGRFMKKPEKKEELKEIPPDRIKKLQESGISEAEIISTLKKEGYSFQDIDNAMGSALKTGIDKKPEEASPTAPRTYEEVPPQTQQPSQTPANEYAPQPFLEEQPVPSEPLEQQQDVFNPKTSTREEVEEIVEVVTEEKLADFDTKIGNLEDKVNKMNEAIQKLSSSLQDVVNQGKKDKENLNTKLEEFSNQINENAPRINSLEKAFKENIPSLIDEVKGFSERIKKKTKKKKISE